MPRVSQIICRLIGRKIGEQLRTSVRKGFPPEGRQKLFRLRVEIACRYRRTDFALRSEEATHVPSVFAQQGMGFVFWRALEMDERALLLLFAERVAAGRH